VTDLAQASDDAMRTVIDRRLAQFFAGGSRPRTQPSLAPRLEIDLREALYLMERGCPSATAGRILL
jgi:hypothetical protein